eukprot:9426274-Pyramimonas_sp.AAC.1
MAQPAAVPGSSRAGASRIGSHGPGGCPGRGGGAAAAPGRGGAVPPSSPRPTAAQGFSSRPLQGRPHVNASGPLLEEAVACTSWPRCGRAFVIQGLQQFLGHSVGAGPSSTRR